jgi:hypothetical protein
MRPEHFSLHANQIPSITRSKTYNALVAILLRPIFLDKYQRTYPDELETETGGYKQCQEEFTWLLSIFIQSTDSLKLDREKNQRIKKLN